MCVIAPVDSSTSTIWLAAKASPSSLQLTVTAIVWPSAPPGTRPHEGGSLATLRVAVQFAAQVAFPHPPSDHSLRPPGVQPKRWPASRVKTLKPTPVHSRAPVASLY